MQKDQELGTITVGKRVDLVVVEGNPVLNISDIRRAVMVVKDGQVYEPKRLYPAIGGKPL